MMGRRQKLISGDEWDAVSRRLRRIIFGFGRPGHAKKIKQAMNRRARRNAKLKTKEMPQ